MTRAPLTLLLAPLLAPAPAMALPAGAEVPAVGAQGRFLTDEPALLTSPRATMALRALPVAGDVHELRFDLSVEQAGRPRVHLHDVRANAFLPTDTGRVVAIDAHESGRHPTRVLVIEPAAARTHELLLPPLQDPFVDADGRRVLFRTAGRGAWLDPLTLEQGALPAAELLATAPGGLIAGVHALPDRAELWWTGGGPVAVPSPVRALAWRPDGSGILLGLADALLELEPATGTLRRIARVPEGGELRDLRVEGASVHLGLVQRSGTASRGATATLTPGGISLTLGGALSLPIGSAFGHQPVDLPWPLGPGTQRPVGNTYGEYQNYGGSPYMHPGVDVMGDPGEALYAVRGGEVKAILTTSGQYHWRIAIAETPGSATARGYLYAHVDLPTVAVSVGDVVVPGQYLGDLVPWPVANFTHCHFARIEDTGVQWSGDWLCTDNPHTDFTGQTETEAPVFEPALGSDLFAFCRDETSLYLDPSNLDGRVDIVAHVGDRIASTWVCSVQELRLSIWPLADPSAPVVDDLLSVRFDMALDTYQDGPIDPFLVDLLYKQDGTCTTEGDYGDREFFHVVTNSDGDGVYEAGDAARAWDTTLVPDGDYVVSVRALDAAGNEASAWMTVTVDN